MWIQNNINETAKTAFEAFCRVRNFNPANYTLTIFGIVQADHKTWVKYESKGPTGITTHYAPFGY